jgi:hypothetical protein
MIRRPSVSFRSAFIEASLSTTGTANAVVVPIPLHRDNRGNRPEIRTFSCAARPATGAALAAPRNSCPMFSRVIRNSLHCKKIIPDSFKFPSIVCASRSGEHDMGSPMRDPTRRISRFEKGFSHVLHQRRRFKSLFLSAKPLGHAGEFANQSRRHRQCRDSRPRDINNNLRLGANGFTTRPRRSSPPSSPRRRWRRRPR